MKIVTHFNKWKKGAEKLTKFRHYLAKLINYFTEKNIKPENIYNADEMSFFISLVK